jgi:hypothetical protein
MDNGHWGCPIVLVERRSQLGRLSRPVCLGAGHFSGDENGGGASRAVLVTVLCFRLAVRLVDKANSQVVRREGFALVPRGHQANVPRFEKCPSTTRTPIGNTIISFQIMSGFNHGTLSIYEQLSLIFKKGASRPQTISTHATESPVRQLFRPFRRFQNSPRSIGSFVLGLV